MFISLGGRGCLLMYMLKSIGDNIPPVRNPVLLISPLMVFYCYILRKTCPVNINRPLFLPFGSGASSMSLSSRFWSTVLRYKATSRLRLHGSF